MSTIKNRSYIKHMGCLVNVSLLVLSHVQIECHGTLIRLTFETALYL